LVKTVTEGFKTLRSSLEITQPQQQAVSGRQQSIREYLKNSKFDINDDFLIGSYARQTMIGPLSDADVDIFFVLDSKYYHEAQKNNEPQASLLDRVRSLINNKYPSTAVSRNGQAVTIKFTDYYVDVVPGFLTQSNDYLIPDSVTKRWIYTNPKKHNAVMAQTNAKLSNNFIPLIKMIKCWNRNIGSYFSSFHLEVLGTNIFTGLTISDFPSGALTYFNNGILKIDQRCPDPAGFDDDLGTYLNSAEKKLHAKRLFEKAMNHAQEAILYDGKGKPDLAIAEWKHIFGNYFPAYG
jgi:hypothetical protein